MIKQIHHQTAKKILKKFSYLINPEYVDTYTVEEIYFRIKHGENHLLSTGAKMSAKKEKSTYQGTQWITLMLKSCSCRKLNFQSENRL